MTKSAASVFGALFLAATVYHFDLELFQVFLCSVKLILPCFSLASNITDLLCSQCAYCREAEGFAVCFYFCLLCSVSCYF